MCDQILLICFTGGSESVKIMQTVMTYDSDISLLASVYFSRVVGSYRA